MSMADQAFGRIGLSDLVYGGDRREFGMVGLAVIVGCVMLKAMALPLISLGGLCMVVVAIFVGHVVNRFILIQEEQKQLEDEHRRQIDLANELMLTPASIK